MSRRYYPTVYARTATTQIRRLRQQRGWTAHELGTRCNPPITRATIAKTECGQRTLTVDELCAFALALGVSVTMLLTGDCDRCHNQPEPGWVCGLCNRRGAEP